MNYEEIDAKDPDTLTEVEKVALLGRPCLGDTNTKIQIRIRENKEFKVGKGGSCVHVQRCAEESDCFVKHQPGMAGLGWL